MSVRFSIAAAILTAAIFGGHAALADSPSSQPATLPALDPQLAAQMAAVDAKAQQIKSLKADFRQEKFTAMLKKPLVSSGTVLAKGSIALWNTTAPEPTIMRVSEKKIELYYPKQGAEELYDLEGNTGALASSPLPRLDVLKQLFRFEALPAKELPGGMTASQFLGLRMLPIDASLAQHVAQVIVLLDRNNGLLRMAETTDPDGEKTRLSFSHPQINAALSDAELQLHLPAGTTVSHPAEGMSQGNPGDGSTGH